MTLNKIIEEEAHLRQQIRNLIEELANKIRKNPMPGLNIQNERSFCVPADMVFEFGNWTPEFYSPYVQASAVADYLGNAETATEFCRRIKTLLEEQKIKNSKSTVNLNPRTVSIIRMFVEQEGLLTE